MALPPELMGLIFLECASDHPLGFDRIIPLSFSKVCFRWRQIALGIPVLWSRFNFSPMVSLTFVQEWLDRTSDRPLHICHTGIADQSIAPQIVAMYIQQAHRLESLSLRLVDLAPFAALKGHLPCLRKLGISRESSFLLRSNEGMDTFAVAPALREVVMEAGTQVSIPWPQITYFESHGATVADILGVLSQAACLCTATLKQPKEVRPSHPAHVIACLSLCSLELTSSPSCVLLDYLTVPNLQTFTVKANLPRESISFVGRSSHLQKLVIENWNGMHDTSIFIRCLRAAPLLVEFHLQYVSGTGTGLTKNDVRVLTVEPGYIPIVPKLEVLVASVHSLTSDRAVTRMVMSRLMPNGWASVAKLEVVTLLYSRQMKTMLLAQLLNRRKEGLDISIIFAQPEALASHLYWARKARRRAKHGDRGSVDSRVLRYHRWRQRNPDYISNDSW
jgi:hypothetical protein